MPVATVGFDHIHLCVEDVTAALRFYQAAFGAEVMSRVGDGLVFVQFAGGEVVALDGRPQPERNPEHIGLRLAAGQDLNGAIEEVVRAGGVLLERGEHVPGIRYAYLADPDGNVFEL